MPVPDNFCNRVVSHYTLYAVRKVTDLQVGPAPAVRSMTIPQVRPAPALLGGAPLA